MLKTKQVRASQSLPSDHTTVLRRDRFDLGFTQSEITTWDDCAEKWYLGYNHLLRKRGGFNWYFVVGDGIHETLDGYYRSGQMKVARLQLPEDVVPSVEEQADLRLEQAILGVLMERYQVFYPDDLQAWQVQLSEEIIETEFEGVKLRAKIDLDVLAQDQEIMVDHKSYKRSDPTSITGWNFRFQFMFYLWILRRVTGRKINHFLVNGIKRPELKQGKNESVESFLVRIKQDIIQIPEKYFQRTPLYLVKDSMKHFEKRVLMPKIERIHLLTEATTTATIIEALVRNQNTNNCVNYGKVCPFLPICQNGFKREGFQFVERQNKHEELDEA